MVKVAVGISPGEAASKPISYNHSMRRGESSYTGKVKIYLHSRTLLCPLGVDKCKYSRVFSPIVKVNNRRRKYLKSNVNPSTCYKLRRRRR